jgi:hypothetical protein
MDKIKQGKLPLVIGLLSSIFSVVSTVTVFSFNLGSKIEANTSKLELFRQQIEAENKIQNYRLSNLETQIQVRATH